MKFQIYRILRSPSRILNFQVFFYLITLEKRRQNDPVRTEGGVVFQRNLKVIKFLEFTADI